MEVKSLGETEQLAADFVETLVSNTEHATVIGLRGDLGSGKTTFTQSLLKAFGVTDVVTSPTFVIQKRYALNDERFDTLVHMDVYRLESGDELKTLHWDELIDEPKNLILIEWPENVQGAMPEWTRYIDFTFVDEYIRDIEFLNPKP